MARVRRMLGKFFAVKRMRTAWEVLLCEWCCTLCLAGFLVLNSGFLYSQMDVELELALQHYSINYLQPVCMNLRGCFAYSHQPHR